MTNLIYIRPLKREDAMTSYQWRNDPEIWRYTGSRPDRVITPEIELQWIDKVLADTTCRRFAICLCETHQYIGNVQLTGIKDGCATFHIFIGEKSMWHKGIGTMATRKMVEYAQNELGLQKLKLWVNTQNVAAVKAYRKSGFQEIDDQGNMEVLL